jgi:hypothetical protein
MNLNPTHLELVRRITGNLAPSTLPVDFTAFYQDLVRLPMSSVKKNSLRSERMLVHLRDSASKY